MNQGTVKKIILIIILLLVAAWVLWGCGRKQAKPKIYIGYGNTTEMSSNDWKMEIRGNR